MGYVFRYFYGLCMAVGVAMAAAHAAPAPQRVDLPPLPSGVVLRAHWLPAATQSGQPSQPAVLALHDEDLAERLDEWRARQSANTQQERSECCSCASTS